MLYLFLSNIIDLVDHFLPFHLTRQWCISNIQLPLWSTKLSSNVIKLDEIKWLAFVSTRRIRQYKSSSLFSSFCTSYIIHLKSQHSFLSRLVILFHSPKANRDKWTLLYGDDLPSALKVRGAEWIKACVRLIFTGLEGSIPDRVEDVIKMVPDSS